jgi:hypothetical protein
MGWWSYRRRPMGTSNPFPLRRMAPTGQISMACCTRSSLASREVSGSMLMTSRSPRRPNAKMLLPCSLWIPRMQRLHRMQRLWSLRAEVVAFREQDLHHGGAELLQLGGDGLHLHAGDDARRAGRGQPPVDAHGTDPARPLGRDAGVVAQGGNEHAVLRGRRHQQRAGRSLAGFPVYRERDDLGHGPLLIPGWSRRRIRPPRPAGRTPGSPARRPPARARRRPRGSSSAW